MDTYVGFPKDPKLKESSFGGLLLGSVETTST